MQCFYLSSKLYMIQNSSSSVIHFLNYWIFNFKYIYLYHLFLYHIHIVYGCQVSVNSKGGHCKLWIILCNPEDLLENLARFLCRRLTEIKLQIKLGKWYGQEILHSLTGYFGYKYLMSFFSGLKKVRYSLCDRHFLAIVPLKDKNLIHVSSYLLRLSEFDY